MCGRIVLASEADELARLFEAAPANDLPDLPNHNVCPTNRVPVVASAEGARRLAAMRWGLIPRWAKAPSDGPLLINARAETVAEKPAFREAVRERRCLVPATGFYEWTKDEDGGRLPWYIRPRDGGVLALAGIWQAWAPKDGDPVETCAVVTTAAGDDTGHLHHRTPVIVPPEARPLWLGEAEGKAAPLMRTGPAGTLEAWRVDPEVNSNRARGPHLIEPLAAHAPG